MLASVVRRRSPIILLHRDPSVLTRRRHRSPSTSVGRLFHWKLNGEQRERLPRAPYPSDVGETYVPTESPLGRHIPSPFYDFDTCGASRPNLWGPGGQRVDYE